MGSTGRVRRGFCRTHRRTFRSLEIGRATGSRGTRFPLVECQGPWRNLVGSLGRRSLGHRRRLHILWRLNLRTGHQGSPRLRIRFRQLGERRRRAGFFSRRLFHRLSLGHVGRRVGRAPRIRLIRNVGRHLSLNFDSPGRRRLLGDIGLLLCRLGRRRRRRDRTLGNRGLFSLRRRLTQARCRFRLGALVADNGHFGRLPRRRLNFGNLPGNFGLGLARFSIDRRGRGRLARSLANIRQTRAGIPGSRGGLLWIWIDYRLHVLWL